MPARPAVAVITAVRNAEATLERTLASVARQSWRPLEHLVVDGASTDGTRAILERRGNVRGGRLRWISEPDRGLYDAMNKALLMVSDPDAYVVFLNADDTFHADDAIERALDAARARTSSGRLRRDEALDYRDVIDHGHGPRWCSGCCTTRRC
jgi:glycosyltransferase involved in cell wall biosynthesis